MSLSEEAVSQVEEFREGLRKVDAALAPLLSLASSSDLPALDRAQLQVALAAAINVLQLLQARVAGRTPAEALRKEGERVQQYVKKVSKAVAAEELKALRPSYSLDVAAANRFIDHAIPDLTDEQRQRLRQASEASAAKRKQPAAPAAAEAGAAAGGSGKKRKQQQQQQRPVRDEALAFLAQIQQEVFSAPPPQQAATAAAGAHAAGDSNHSAGGGSSSADEP